MDLRTRDFFKYYLPVILWMAFIFWMSTGTFSAENTSSYLEMVLRFFHPKISAVDMNFIHTIVRKLAHLTEYFIMGILFFRAYRGPSVERWKWRWSLYALLSLAIWAAGDEFHQSFVSTRTASIKDVFIDTAGGVLAQFAMILKNGVQKNRSKLDESIRK